MCDFREQIESAKEEIAKWTDEKKSYVQLEGTDKYLQQYLALHKDANLTQKKDLASNK